MSYSLDVNILLHASNEGGPLHVEARGFLERCARGREPLCLSWSTLLSYVRISTHPGVFANPLTPDEAVRNVARLVGLPQAHVIVEKPGFLTAYEEATQGMAVRGNLVPDAHLAALLLQHGIRKLYTTDRDFRKFLFLEVENPFEEAR